MPIIESFFKWAMIIVVGLMVLAGVGSAVFAGAVGLMSDPTFILIVFVGFLFFALLLVVPVALSGAWAWRWWRRSAIQEERAKEFVAPDEHGRLPVPASLLRTPVGAQVALAQNVASFASNLTHYHHSPVYENTYSGIGEQQLADQQPSWQITPSFGELLQQGQIGNGRFLLGYDLTNGKPVTADWTGLYSGGIAGQQASGKTSTVRNLLCQSLLNGADVAVIDPHAVYSEDSLSQSIAPLHSHLHTPIASEESDIVQMVRYTGAMMDARVTALKKDQRAAMQPFVLIVDEMMHLLESDTVSPDLNRLVKRLVTEGRKLKVYMLTISHVYAANLFEKGSSVRALLGTRIVHTLDATAARVLVPNDYAKQAESLQQGQAILKANMLGTYRVGIPYCTVDDCEIVAERLSTLDRGKGEVKGFSRGSEALPTHFQETENDGPKVDGKWMGSGWEAPNFTPNFKAMRVRDLILQGKNQTEIIKEVWGISGGKRYGDAIAEYNKILRQLLLNGGD